MRSIATELRLLAPIVLCYCCWLGVVICTAVGADRVGGNRLESWCEYAMIATSGAGIWMVAVWVALYGMSVLLRCAYAAVLVATVTSVGVLAYVSLQGGEYFGRHFWSMLAVIVACSVGFFALCVVPLLGTRWLLQWRIVDASQRETTAARASYSVNRILWLTAAVAIACTALSWTADALSVAPRGSFYMSAAALLSAGGFLQLVTMSRVPMRFVWPVSFLLAVLVTAALTLQYGFFSGWNLGQRPYFAVFAIRAVACYSLATLMVLITASYLRGKGVLIRCGGTAGYGGSLRRSPPRGDATSEASVEPT